MVVFLDYINSKNSDSDKKTLEYCFSAAVLEFVFRAKDAKIYEDWMKRYTLSEKVDAEEIAREYSSMNGRPITRRFMQEIMAGQHQEFAYDIDDILKQFYNEMFKKNKS